MIGTEQPFRKRVVRALAERQSPRRELGMVEGRGAMLLAEDIGPPLFERLDKGRALAGMATRTHGFEPSNLLPDLLLLPANLVALPGVLPISLIHPAAW